ncbi:receptor-like protein EIX2 [Hevea brasiliensis]|uniref:receptor-like protein EIX2 n=1 Tax=Hevea brasiliensis TaxID=3981 RepID=UPI0025D69D3B|nr:receptor-like protein EIX2 [Hevea brasiliensis]
MKQAMSSPLISIAQILLRSCKYLDLSTGKGFPLKASNLDWLSGLSSLKVLDLSAIYLSDVVNWLDAINMLPSSAELRLVSCQLHNLPQSLPSLNFSSLEIFDLSYNSFYSMIPNWLVEVRHTLRLLNLTTCWLQGSIPHTIVNFTPLAVLDFSYNNLTGFIPHDFGNMTSLVVLDFSYNNLKGSIPHDFGNMTSLSVLDLSSNYLEGPLPATLGLIQESNFKHSPLQELRLSYNYNLNGSLERILPQLSELVILDVAGNYLDGVITEAHFQNFSRLKVLDLSENPLILNVSSNWIPDFQLQSINLFSCQIGPRFPHWLQNQKRILKLDMSNASISATVPDWFWDISSSMKHLDLSQNQLRGGLPNLSSKTSLMTLNLGENEFGGHLPQFPPTIQRISLYNNQFSGSISQICDMMNESNTLLYLSLPGNVLSGSLPDCWTYGKILVHLNLGSNKLYGQIPESIGHLINLKMLVLNNNSLSGEIPQSLQNCRRLVFLDLGNNELSGSIPTWLGESLGNLQVISLYHNAFKGIIPLQLCQLRHLYYLVLSSNSLSGPIPQCIDNFKEAEPSLHEDYASYTKDELKSQMWTGSLVTYGPSYKGMDLSYNMAYKRIDLSHNMLSGEIPREVTTLTGLNYLNLANNSLTGAIPCDIGAMKSLHYLKLSRNQLSGTIPPSITDLLDLELNLSYNNLSGKVPSPNNFSAYAFIGNHNLCGPPLARNCSVNDSFEETECSTNRNSKGQNDGIQEKEHRHRFEEKPSFYISVASGFVTGFWGFWATLVFNESWRHAYFRFLGNMGDKIYVFVAVTTARLRRKFQREQAVE